MPIPRRGAPPLKQDIKSTAAVSRESRGPETGPGLENEVAPPGQTRPKADRSENFDDDMVR